MEHGISCREVNCLNGGACVTLGVVNITHEKLAIQKSFFAFEKSDRKWATDFL